VNFSLAMKSGATSGMAMGISAGFLIFEAEARFDGDLDALAIPFRT
jgi:hypothetical protein